jgi:putative oxidoreductase
MRNAALLGARLILGSYLAVHGAQKLFGAFGGRGLHGTGAGFEAIGLTPGKHMAALAGASELGGGVLTAAGVADPLGPIMIMGTMAVAATTHRANGPLAARGGFELPLTNFAVAAALAAAGPGRFRAGLRLPRPLILLTATVGGTLAAASVAKLILNAPSPDDSAGARAGSGESASAGDEGPQR